MPDFVPNLPWPPANWQDAITPPRPDPLAPPPGYDQVFAGLALPWQSRQPPDLGAMAADAAGPPPAEPSFATRLTPPTRPREAGPSYMTDLPGMGPNLDVPGWPSRPAPDLGAMAEQARVNASVNPDDITIGGSQTRNDGITPTSPADIELDPAPTRLEDIMLIGASSRRDDGMDPLGVLRPVATPPGASARRNDGIITDPGVELPADGPSPAPGYEQVVAGLDRPLPFGNRPVPDLGAAAEAAGAVIRDPRTGTALTGPGALVNLDGSLPRTDPRDIEIDTSPNAVAQVDAAHPRPGTRAFVRSLPGAPVDYEAPGTPILPPPGEDTASNVTLEPDKDIQDANDLARLAKSERFAPDRDPTANASPADIAEGDRLNTIDANAKRLGTMDPYQYAEAKQKYAQAAENERATKVLEATQRDRQAMEQNIANRERARAKAQAEVDEVSNAARNMADSSPFEAWWGDRSVPQKVAGILATVLGGINNPNGPNSALDMMIGTANAAADAKWKKIEARRQMAGDALRDADADFKEREAIRLASLEQMGRAIEAQMAMFDPNGTAALRLAEVKRGVDEQIANSLTEMGKYRDKLALDQFQAETARMQAEAQMMNAQSLAAKRSGGGGSGSGTGAPTKLTTGWTDKDVRTPADWVAHFDPDGKFELAKILGDQPLTGKTVKELLDVRKGLQQAEIEAARQKSVEQSTAIEKDRNIAGRALNYNGKPLYQYDETGHVVVDENGKPVPLLSPTEDEGKLGRAKIGKTVNVIQELDKAIGIIENSTKVDRKDPSSDANKRLAVIGKGLAPLAKEGTQGMSSDADMQNLVGSLGAESLTSLFDQLPKLKEGRRRALAILNNDLHQVYRYNGPPISIPNAYEAPKAKKDELGSRLMARPYGTGRGFGAAASKAAHAAVGDGYDKDALDQVTAAIERDKDPQAASTLLEAALNAPNLEARKAAAYQVWRYRRMGSPVLVEAFNALSPSQQAAVMANSPDTSRDDLAGMFPDGAIVPNARGR